MFLRRHWWAVLYSLFLTAFTIYLAMDTFVISRVYAVVPESQNQTNISASSDTEKEEVSISDTEIVLSKTAYSDGNIDITITEYREYESTIYVADIILSSPEYLQSAFAQNAYGHNVTAKTSEIAQGTDAILAINGDYYGAQEAGYVLRNGVIYRNTAIVGQEDLVIYEDGSFGIIREDEIAAEELLANGAQQILSFGPALITEGTIAVSDGDEVGKAMASNPRTAIGIIDNLHYVFVVSDGRTDESAGLSLSQLAAFMSELGAVTAYNLDGGGSSTMYFNGEIINNPTTNGRSIKERNVSDIVYIGY
ncbi:MAG: phosphodiester glycosidase family protein [Candidatus Merdivicinus sp.]|jgi:exopolysaccharide biosynthesis protein